MNTHDACHDHGPDINNRLEDGNIEKRAQKLKEKWASAF